MRTYIKFLSISIMKSFIFVSSITLCLVFILNLLSELDFFKDINVSTFFPIYMSLLNSPTLLFEMFPFIMLLSSQLFFINLFENNQIEIFKYSGLKNSKLLLILSTIIFLISLIIIIFFYNFSTSLKNLYLETKSSYTNDNKYLAVITKNGLWIKDKIQDKNYIINASSMEENFLLNGFITEFDESYNVIRNIQSKKINVKTNEWILYDVKIFLNNSISDKDQINLFSNFNYDRIISLFSNLSSLSVFELFELKRNYEMLNYSTTEISMQINKVIFFPVYLVLMSLISGLIMLNVKRLGNATFKILIGLFLSVLIYYLNNFFMVLGNTEKVSHIIAILAPQLMLASLIIVLFLKINDK